VQVVRDRHIVKARPYIASRSEIALLERRRRIEMIEAADVRAHDRAAVDDQRDGVLQIAADGEDRLCRGERATAAGAYPRERRRITGPSGPAVATESSTRRAIGRSPLSSASASGSRLSRASSSR